MKTIAGRTYRKIDAHPYPAIAGRPRTDATAVAMRIAIVVQDMAGIFGFVGLGLLFTDISNP
jgi:hypothetical protein